MKNNKLKKKTPVTKIESLEPMVLMSASASDGGVDVIDTNSTSVNSDLIEGVVVESEVDRFALVNRSSGVIDPGVDAQAAAVLVNNGDTPGESVRGIVVNRGDIAGRGQAGPAGADAGDGLRFLGGASADTVFAGTVVNTGSITSDSNQGPTAAVRFSDNVGFEGLLFNSRNAVIAGANNGLYFGDAEHNARVINTGTISSDSRAVNIDGSGVNLSNFGQIIGTGDQRNGTIYSDATADDFSIVNNRRGVIDAGEGNDGAGIALQTGDSAGDIVDATITNRGSIVGRGQAAPTDGTAGDGVRIFAGAEGGTTFRGSLINRGDITSESDQGTTSAVRVANGVGFEGIIRNDRGGVIAGANNGLYFGDAEHDVTATNRGTISSDSRAVNIDGTGVDFVNSGRVLGTGDQRNGTIYADSTADDYTIVNTRRGLVDAGSGNNGSGISLQTGDVDNDVVNGSVRNDGVIRGRGDTAEGNTIGDGVRIFAGAGNDAVFQGDIVNNGRIFASGSDEAVAIRVEGGIAVDGQIVNTGLLSAGQTAIDTSDAGGDSDILNSGLIRGDVILSDGNDTLDNSRGFITGDISGGAGDDFFIAGRSSETFLFGADDGSDVISNFSVNRDQIDVSGAGIQSLQDLQIDTVNGNAVIQFAGTTITLEGVSASELDANDFVFATGGIDSLQAIGEIFAFQNSVDDDSE